MKNRGECLAKADFERYRIGALAKGLAILRAVAEAEEPLSASQIAEYGALNTVTAYRFLTTLQGEGYLEQDPFTKRYSLTPKVLELGFRYLNGLGFIERAEPFLRRLAQQTGETTNMAVLDETEIVFVARVASRSLFSINIQIGSRLPACFSAMGQVLLAALDRTEVLRRISGIEFNPPTGRGPQTAQDLISILRHVSRKGHAINDQDLEIGIRSAAAPVCTESGAIVASINIAVPATRVSKSQLKTSLVPLLMSTAHDISRALGDTGSLVTNKARNTGAMARANTSLLQAIARRYQEREFIVS